MPRNKVTKTCESCGSLCVRNRNKFCSFACRKPNGNKHKDSVCLECKENIATGSKKFCTSSCAAKFNNSVKGYKLCKNCGIPNKRQCLYCTKECLLVSLKFRTFSKVENGQIKSPNILKEYLLSKRGHKCEICGLAEWRGQKAPLVMDHIDGNSRDNSLSNLRLVCGNCDMQLDTYKSKNKGKGRHSRRVRYSEGKSY